MHGLLVSTGQRNMTESNLLSMASNIIQSMSFLEVHYILSHHDGDLSASATSCTNAPSNVIGTKIGHQAKNLRKPFGHLLLNTGPKPHPKPAFKE